MKKRKEETEDGERRMKSREDHASISKSLEHLPLDLIPDILLRLPAKSVARFRCVSKLWSSITTRPDFISSFAAHQSSTRLCLLISVKARDKRCLISLPQHEHPVTSYSHVDEKFDFHHQVRYSESVQGLICLEGFYRIIVWNPTMKQHVILPELKPKLMFTSSYMGYDPVENKYKVLCFTGLNPHVFTLGPQESWRAPQNRPIHLPLYTIRRIGKCINGHVYYPANSVSLENKFEVEEILMSFDVRYEKFNIIRKPNDDKLYYLLFNYEGKLAWVRSDFSCLRFWVLENEEKQEWSPRNFPFPFSSFPRSDALSKVKLSLSGVTYDTGEFIYLASRYDEIYVLYYDPKRNRIRRVIYTGIGDKDMDRNWDIISYPNHIESLMSLENVPHFQLIHIAISLDFFCNSCLFSLEHTLFHRPLSRVKNLKPKKKKLQKKMMGVNISYIL